MSSTSISLLADTRLLLDLSILLCAWSLMLLSIFRTIHRYRNPHCRDGGKTAQE